MSTLQTIKHWEPGDDNSAYETRPPVMPVPGTRIRAWKFNPDDDSEIILDGIARLLATALPTGVTVQINVVTPANGTGAVRFGVSLTVIDTGADTALGGTYGTEVASNTTVDATAGEAVTISIAMTNAEIAASTADALASGQAFRLKLRRIGSNAGDTHTGPAYVTAVLAYDT